jgi:hypothetical protein
MVRAIKATKTITIRAVKEISPIANGAINIPTKFITFIRDSVGTALVAVRFEVRTGTSPIPT